MMGAGAVTLQFIHPEFGIRIGARTLLMLEQDHGVR
jgi:hypothetical protein